MKKEQDRKTEDKEFINEVRKQAALWGRGGGGSGAEDIIATLNWREKGFLGKGERVKRQMSQRSQEKEKI